MRTCNKCKGPSVAEVACNRVNCDKVYRRCAKHGGIAGALRSLRSHSGLYHSFLDKVAAEDAHRRDWKCR